MSRLGDALGKPPIVKRGPSCAIALEYDRTQDDADAAALLAAINGSEWNSNALSERLRSLGIALSSSSIRRHRLRHCLCRDLRPELTASV
jgi:hypothetical protein